MFFMICLILSFAFFSYKRLLISLLFFQQERYKNINFLKFIFHKLQLIDKNLTCVVFLYSILSIAKKSYVIDASVLSILFILFGIMQLNPFANNNKNKLDMTYKTKIILGLSSLISISFSVFIFYNMYNLENYCLCNVIGYLLLLIQILPFILIISNLIFHPLEMIAKYKYVKDAKKKLNQLNPIVIAITGSFGKTSTKNILFHILSSVVPTLTTERSINTLLGISKVIKKNLKKHHKYFIVEVGTSGPGKIQTICNLIKPKFGILTAIGFAHFENFKNQDALAKEKLSLIHSVEKNNGFSIINKCQVEEKFIPNIKNVSFLSNKIVNDDDFSVINIMQNINGISFDLVYQNNIHKISAPIFGTHQAYNISMAIIMANKIGIPMDTILATLASLKQVEHRLEVKKHSDGITIIDDGFNSNMDGFLSALDTLKALAVDGRAILITPGMVDLGNKHKEQHIQVALKAIDVCDIVIAVVPDRIKDFVDTFKQNMKHNQQIILVDSFKEALMWTSQNTKKGDVILYENDLPDVFETKIKI